jgi:CRP/FNR family cyclic AMP-dependent transcriptional regulator
VSTQGGDEYESPSLQMLMRRSWEQPTERDWTEVLGALPLFSQLGKRQVRRLARLATVVDYAPEEDIVRAGERGDSFYLLLEGRATVVGKSSPLRAGDFFGEMALIDGGPRSATITAMTPVRAMKLPRRGFITALEQDVRIGLAIMAVLAERIRRLEQSASA